MFHWLIHIRRDEVFYIHRGKCGKRGHRQRDCFEWAHNLETWDESTSWNLPWSESAWKLEHTTTTQRKQPLNRLIHSKHTESTFERDPTFIFSVNQPYDSHDAYGTSNGPTIDIVVDTGANRSVRGPQHCPDLPIESHGLTKDSVADGSQLRHYGEKVQLKVGREDMQISFHVTDVAQPIPNVNSVNDAGAGVEFSPTGATGPPSTVDSRRERSRLGLRRTFCLFFPRATVFAAVVKDGLPRSPIDLFPTLARGASCLRSSITFVCPVGRP